MLKATSLAFALFALIPLSYAYADAPKETIYRHYKEQYSRVTAAGSIEPPQGQLKDQLDALKQRALSGDANAAAAIYAGLGGCSTLRGSGDVAQFEMSCHGITKDDTAEEGKWLALAAELGNRDAQYNFAAGGLSLLVGSSFTAIKHPEAVQAYRARSKQYLEVLASQCNASAIATIVQDAGGGGLLYGDQPEHAYKYRVVLNTISKIPDDAEEKRFEADVDPTKLFGLRREALSFVETNCK